jgi:hypothetical protein
LGVEIWFGISKLRFRALGHGRTGTLVIEGGKSDALYCAMVDHVFDVLFEAGKIATRMPGFNDRTPPLPNLDSDFVPEEWLINANKRYRSDSMPAKGRPLQALCDYTKEKNAAIRLGSPAADRVFRWFEERSAPGAHRIGTLFSGSYFYDAHFWPVLIPIAYGNVTLTPLASLETMPDPVKIDLSRDSEEFQVYLLYWIDCLDYAYGYDDIRNVGKLTPRSLALLKNADHELRGAVELVSGLHPNPHAALAVRMATELFLKALLVEKAAYTDEALKDLSHKLDKLLEHAERVCEAKEIKTLKRLVSVFPPVSSRYFGAYLKPTAVGNALSTCQMAATTVIRQLSDRDSRSQIFGAA